MDKKATPDQHPVYHVPVMLFECLDALQIQPSGIYVDATFGGGGHSKALLERLGPEGRLIGFDQDPDAQQNMPVDSRFTLIPANFRYLAHFLQYVKTFPVDGILADLGVSSYQFDTGARGFSYRFDGPLDMRMNTTTGPDAAFLLNNMEEKDLEKMFKMFGDLPMSWKLAKSIGSFRQSAPLKTISDLLDCVDPVIPKMERNSILSRLFQAIRMEVNQETESLQSFLLATPKCLKPGGRLVVLSYHSIEDRMVKNLMRSGNPEGKEIRDIKGKTIRPFDPVGKMQIPSSQEIETNPRARSAKLRVGEKI